MSPIISRCPITDVTSGKWDVAEMNGLESIAIRLKHHSMVFLIHCQRCGCGPLFDKTVIIGRNKCEVTHLIIESEKIHYFSDTCISKTSLTFTDKELDFLCMLRWFDFSVLLSAPFDFPSSFVK